MLIGQSRHTIDAKGRLIMPNKFRSDLGDRYIITRGLDNSVNAYPLDEWKELEAAIRALPRAQSKEINRFFFTNAEEVIPDSQGRIVIPQHLREYAGLTKDVVVAGAMSKVEIWDAGKWQNITNGEDSGSIEKIMLEIGF